MHLLHHNSLDLFATGLQSANCGLQTACMMKQSNGIETSTEIASGYHIIACSQLICLICALRNTCEPSRTGSGQLGPLARASSLERTKVGRLFMGATREFSCRRLETRTSRAARPLIGGLVRVRASSSLLAARRAQYGKKPTGFLWLAARRTNNLAPFNVSRIIKH